MPVLELRKKPTKALRASSADDDKAKLKVSFKKKKETTKCIIIIIIIIINVITYNVGLELITPLRKHLFLRIFIYRNFHGFKMPF